ncbi:MAG: hypothetical protein L0Z62_35835 [Gemmataceae bacterium]|nr:hypothetical protein [Gemmataceae bacterium]
MSQPTGGVPPYRVVYSERCREQTRELLQRAAAQERFADVAQAVRDINTRLQWIPLDFGEPLQDLVRLGIQEHIGVLGPLVVKYGVDEARRIV